MSISWFCHVPITGGGSGADIKHAKSVELLTQKDDSSWSSCSLPNLPDFRSTHTQNGGLTCGGINRFVHSSCLTFSSGEWKTSHMLLQQRYEHTTWNSPIGTILMGGSDAPLLTELLNDDGTSTEQFKMKYPTG